MSKIPLQVPDAPHFDPVSLELFSRLLAGRKTYVEYGSGGSTVLASKQGCKTISIESDFAFAQSVKRKVGPNVKMVHVYIGPTSDWGVPFFNGNGGAFIKRPLWSRYPKAPWRYIPTADLVLVDGRFRVACALQSVIHGCQTILMDDYADRPHYKVLERFADLSSMTGRMAVFTPKRDFDIAQCKLICEQYYMDWR